MKLLGITGGVGMGKSTTGTLLKERGVAVIDTDAVARKLTEPDQPVLGEIATVFGPSILSPDGALDRKELAQRVFASGAERAKLEAILHPKIAQVWGAEAERWRAEGVELGAVIIPLLYETHAEFHFDAVICVACRPEFQVARLQERGWSKTEIRQRIDAQWPTTDKISRANFVIWTDGAPEAHGAQLDLILRRLKTPAALV